MQHNLTPEQVPGLSNSLEAIQFSTKGAMGADFNFLLDELAAGGGRFVVRLVTSCPTFAPARRAGENRGSHAFLAPC